LQTNSGFVKHAAEVSFANEHQAVVSVVVSSQLYLVFTQ